MTDKKYYMWVIPTVLVVGLLVGLVFSFQTAQADSTAPASVEANSAVASCTLDTTGAISYWPLDETSGTSFTDTVGVVYNGSCSGDSCPSTITGTNNGGQFFFDTDSDVISAGGFTYNFTAVQDLSVGIWVKTTQVCDGNKVFIGRYKNLNTDGSWWLGCVPGSTPGEGVARFHMRDSDDVARIVTGSTPINNGEWHYIVGVRDGSGDTNKLYVDGNLEATETSPTFTGNFTSSAPLTMGAYDEPTDYYFNGTLDEAAVYGTALSESFINTYITTNCSFPIDIRDVAFDTGKNIPIEITALELLDGSSGAGSLTITSVDSSSEKSGIVNISYSTLAGPFTYTPPTDYVGSDFFTFEVFDGADTARGTAIITQKSPVVTNPGPQADYEGALITPLQIVATDPQDDTLT